MRAIVAVLLTLAFAGCLRVGPGEDIALVCEPKTMAPGPAYGPEDLLRLTTWGNATLPREEALALVTAAQPHVITMSRAPHQALHATLAEEDAWWRFRANATTVDGTLDEYDVLIDAGPPARAVSDEVQPPASVVAAATRVVERSEDMADFRARAPALVGATWDDETSSCVTLHYAGGERVVANVAQGRVVLKA